MNIFLVTPSGSQAISGNRTTALRWRQLLVELGHQVVVDTTWQGQATDLMIALHAWRSADSIMAFHNRYPDRPLIVALAGTDIYRFIHSHPKVTLQSIEVATGLVALHDLAYRTLPKTHWPKLTVIKQSARALCRQQPRKRTFDICVAANLREEKNPLQAALAVRTLPANSKVRILHYGRAHQPHWSDQARLEMQANHRYHWFDEVPYWQLRRTYARAQALIVSSRMEGGANVVSEAIMSDLPVLASQIDGSVGLLGEDYRGYYPAEDTNALQQLIQQLEQTPDFLLGLSKQIKALKPQFTITQERMAWQQLLKSGGGIKAEDGKYKLKKSTAG